MFLLFKLLKNRSLQPSQKFSPLVSENIFYSKNNVGSQGWWSTESLDLSRSNAKTEMWMWRARGKRKTLFLRKFSSQSEKFNTRSWSEVETIAKSRKCFQCSIGCLSALWETVKYLHVALLTFRPHAGGFLNRKPSSQEKIFSRFVSNLMKIHKHQRQHTCNGNG